MGALETTTITTHIETSSFRHPKNVGPLYYVEFLVKNFTPSMWRKPQRPCDLFSICGVLTLRLLPQAMLHAAPLCVAAASCVVRAWIPPGRWGPTTVRPRRLTGSYVVWRTFSWVGGLLTNALIHLKMLVREHFYNISKPRYSIQFLKEW